MFIAVAFAWLATALFAQAQGTGTIQGRVYNPATKEYVNNAEVRLEGTGQIELDGTWVPVRPGSVIAIPTMVRHRLQSDGGVKVLIVGSPAYREEDEYFD